MNWFPLPIFPEGSLASSVVTTVWVGVLVFCVMNLRFGWAFSGLVVPGYLVPLIIVKPWAAAVIVLEAALTFWTVLAMTRLMPRFKIACSFFGRDRFMAMILVSALYRVLADTWLLPMLGAYLAEQHGIDFDYRNNLQSFGLIVICLAANQLWKTGIVKGAVPFCFNILVTYLLVRYVLMVFTNFSISNLSFLYEDIATSIYAAPKAYIVLITTSVLASRMNLLYGWDFNGIMIPALIALQWYEPAKVLTSFAEALVILGAGMLALRLPLLRSMTIEGSRKLLLFFTISFLYKMAIGWGLLFAAPEMKVSDFYGFGYLLPTLMAIKMHQQGKVLHQLRITLQISIVSIVVANAIGFALTFLPDHGAAAHKDVVVLESRRLDESELEASATRSFVDSHAAVTSGVPTAPGPEAIYLFERSLDALAKFAAAGSEATFEGARRELASAGFRIDRIGDRYLQVAPADPASGRPLLVIDRLSSSDLAVECPRALDELDTYDAALALFQDQGARVLAIAGSSAPPRGDELGDYGAARSWLASIHRSLGRDGAIQVRRASQPGGPSRLYVKRALPDALNLRQLEEQFGAFTPLWEAPPENNPLRDASRAGFCELFLSDAALVPGGAEIPIPALDEPIDSLVRRELYEFAPKATDLYRPPSAAELLHIDRNILRPLFAGTAPQLRSQLARIRHHASFYGYDVTAYDGGGGAIYALLQEATPRRYWGSVLIRADAAPGGFAPWCFEIPSRVEDRSLMSFAATQFKRLGARALIAAGTNSLTNSDGSATLTSMQNQASFFTLAHEAFVRSAQSAAPVAIQCRAFLPPPGEAYPEGDLILAPYRENRSAEEIQTALDPIIERLAGDGIEIVEVGAADESSPYAVGVNPQARYLDFSADGTFAILWISPFLRENYRLQEAGDPMPKMLRAVGIAIRDLPLESYLDEETFALHSAINESLKGRLRDFREHGDIHIIQHLPEEFVGDSFEAVLDPQDAQLYLICLDPGGRPRLVANLSRQAFERSVDRAAGGAREFIDARAAWLEQGNPQAK